MKMNHVRTKMIAWDFMESFLFPLELCTLAKMNHVSIKMIVLDFVRPLLFPEELYTFAKVKHVSIQMNSTNLNNFRQLYELYTT